MEKDILTDEGIAKLNPDAIYAALCWMRGYSKSDEGQAAFRALMDQKAGTVESFRSLAREVAPGEATVHLIPKFDFTDDDCDSIYPDEQDSVRMGLEFARHLIWGPPGFLADGMMAGDDPLAEALRRYLSDGAH